MKTLTLLLLAAALTGCGSPVTLSGGYETPEGAKYSAGATFVLPEKKGYAK